MKYNFSNKELEVAVEYYLNEVVLKRPVIVTKIEKDNTHSALTAIVTDNEPSDEQSPPM